MPAAIKPLVTIDALNQLDSRVGTIEKVEDVPNADTLCQLRVNFGDHQRTIVAGMRKERANPREIEGKQALFVVNLEPRKMRGVVSEGMLFDIGYADGRQTSAVSSRKPYPGWNSRGVIGPFLKLVIPSGARNLLSLQHPQIW
jgi:tRNA-binding protein